LHDDKSPSLSYSLEKNVFHCWSCGFSGGVTKFLESIGEVTRIPVESKQPFKIQKLKNKIKAIIEFDEVKLPKTRQAFIGEFKNIKASVLKEFLAFTTEELQLHNYLCVPIYQFGKLKFIEGRYMGSVRSQPKYFRRPKKGKVGNILFPLDKVKNTNYIILVEGLFDMLNMWQLGYKNTLAIFGAQNFGRNKLDLVDKIGVNRVDIMMDPDAPGQMAAEKIQSLLDSKNIYSRIIKLPVGHDPGDITKDIAEAALK
jgi:DNA primase